MEGDGPTRGNEISGQLATGGPKIPQFLRETVARAMCRNYSIFGALNIYARFGSPPSWWWSEWGNGTWAEFNPINAPP